MLIGVFEKIGPNCIALDDGQIIYDLVRRQLEAGESVELDFRGVRIFASPFFNAAIGQLLRDFAPQVLNERFKPTGLSQAGLETVRTVIENSREFYASAKKRAQIEAATDLENEK